MTVAKTIAAAVLALCAAAPAFAQDLTPVGTWQTTTGESRYAVSYCGDGTELCAKLTWLRKDAQTPENLALLNQYVVQGAQATAENKWRGTVKYEGHTVSGSVTLVNESRLSLQGCKLIACQKVDFVRI
ncbi:DUF2147 domain-containing protein [Devosia ginsengisoli]|uniref:DUF2147 domain-containing protein n=1 Tax=Devosia ginsengisoli TaxID=400770 RepID=UPI0026EB4265|nr:DUF2147 domain-containing protein [Devosia ginsengisoli]MCR6673337.1 DUF2147 domain-containing protein [Devosia ginsengisoli]